MPFQMAKCEGCGEIDYVEDVLGHWLCRYCRETLEEEGHIVLENGEVLYKGSAFVCLIRLDEHTEDTKGLAQMLHEFLEKAGFKPRSVEVRSATVCPECGGVAVEISWGLGDWICHCLNCNYRFWP